METNDFVVRHISRKFRPLIITGACLMLQISNGFIFTFGNILPYLRSFLLEQSTESLIWLQCFLVSFPFSHLLASFLQRRYGARVVILIGALLYTGSMVLIYFALHARSVMMMLSLGVAMSLGVGLSSTSVLIQALKWMPNRVGLVNGLVLGGFAMGAALMAPIQTHLVNPENHDAFYHNNSKTYLFNHIDLVNRIPSIFLFTALITMFVQAIALMFIADTTSNLDYDDHTAFVNSVSKSTDSSVDLTRQCQFISITKVLRSSTFRFLAVILLLNSYAIHMTLALYKSFGLKYFNDDFFFAMTLSIAALSGALSCGVWGVIADKSSHFTKPLLLACGFGFGAILIFGWVGRIGSSAVFFLLFVIMLISFGGTLTLIPYAIRISFGDKNFGILYGYVQLAMFGGGILNALTIHILNPIIGAHHCFPLAALAMFISFIITSIIYYNRSLNNKAVGGGNQAAAPDTSVRGGHGFGGDMTPASSCSTASGNEDHILAASVVGGQAWSA